MVLKRNYILKKSKGSFLVVGAIIILAFIAFIVIVAGIGLMAELTGNNSGGPGTSGILSCTSSQLSAGDKNRIQNNLSVYQAAADKTNVSWEFLAGIHYKESSLSTTNPNPFQVTNSRTSGFNVASAVEAAEHAKALVKSVYNKTLTKNSDEETIKLAFLAYNRGAMYKNGGCTWDESPYVMNQFDAAHQNMRWPNNSCEPPGTRGNVNTTLGAFTVYSILKGCTVSYSNAKFLGKTALPLSVNEINTIEKFKRYNNSLHGLSISDPTNLKGHNVILGPYPRNYGVNVPRQPGEAVDLMAPTGTSVFAPFDGKVIKTDGLGANGDFIIIQSTDQHSYAVLAHLKNFAATGTIVTVGQKVGELFPLTHNPHLHFELWVNDKPINAGASTTPAQIWAVQKHALGF